MFENRVLRRIFGPKKDEETREWRKLSNECREGVLGPCLKKSYLKKILVVNSAGLNTASECTSDKRITLQKSSQYIRYQDINSSAMTMYQTSGYYHNFTMAY